jgi:hypothetical protein
LIAFSDHNRRLCKNLKRSNPLWDSEQGGYISRLRSARGTRAARLSAGDVHVERLAQTGWSRTTGSGTARWALGDWRATQRSEDGSPEPCRQVAVRAVRDRPLLWSIIGDIGGRRKKSGRFPLSRQRRRPIRPKRIKMGMDRSIPTRSPNPLTRRLQ